MGIRGTGEDDTVINKEQKVEGPEGRGLGFVVSRLCDRKKSQKRGTGHLSWDGLARVESHPRWIGEVGGGLE